MNQETAARSASPEMRKRILLGTLFLVLLGVVYIQFFSGGDDRPGASTVTSNQAARPAGSPTPR
ncbi:MAG: hypothetical protein EBZ36_13875, partial [Acidobacteria bacterium]|nr:hypothetical protein [Acidobacteriota bacterium]